MLKYEIWLFNGSQKEGRIAEQLDKETARTVASAVEAALKATNMDGAGYYWGLHPVKIIVR